MKYFIRPERGHENLIGPTIGPIKNFVQLTYNTLLIGPDGEEIAYYEDGAWIILVANIQHLDITMDFGGLCTIPPGDVNQHSWSDIIIWAEP
jgi:hypothetical protein